VWVKPRPVTHAFLPPQGGVAAASGKKGLVGAALHDPTVVEDDDLVHLLQPRQPVGDEKRGAAFRELTQVSGQRVGGRGVEVLARLVEDQHREVGEQGAGDSDPLALPSRQAAAARTDRGGQAVGEASQPRTQANPGEGVLEFGVG
jgi:hypothetical protein